MKKIAKSTKADKKAMSLRYGVGVRKLTAKERHGIERQDVTVSHKDSYSYVIP